MATQKRMYDKMSSEAMQEQARAINDASSLITKLTNFQDAIQDLERLRLEGARFRDSSDETFQEYTADMDGIRALACGRAGQVAALELINPEPMDRLCHLGEETGYADIEREDLQVISDGIERALIKAQAGLMKLLAV